MPVKPKSTLTRQLDIACKNLALASKDNKTSEKNMKEEIIRIYTADSSFTLLSKKSILILLRLNLRYRAIPLHHFGLHIEI